MQLHPLARRVLCSGAPFLLALTGSAQWSPNAAVNLAVGDRTSEQVTPKVAADGAGGTWIGWFDHASGNYDVYVQHLDRDGVEQFAHNGLLVSNNPSNSSLVDWDLMCDSSGNCVVVFSDARAGSDLDVYAYRISPGGTFLWGANGVALSSNADFEPAPRACETSDGNFVFAWARLPSPGDGTIRVQKLDAAGNPQYSAEGFPISGATGEDLAFCDVVPAENGAYIVSWVRDISNFSSPRHIRAQKFDAGGSALWATFVPVFDQGPIQVAYSPIVQPDGSGGAYFCWPANNQSYVQHLDAAGAEVFPHNGVRVSTEAARLTLEPSLAVLGGGDMIVAFNKRNVAQSQWGVAVQRISAAGARLWTDDGIEIAPLDGTNESFERALPYGDGAIVLWFEEPSTPLLMHRVLARRLDGLGNSVWGAAPVVVCSNLSSKDDIETAIDGSGIPRAAWHDERSDAGDIYAQDVNADGTLGNATNLPSTYCIGAPNSVGPGARIGWNGSTSIGFNNFHLTVSGCPLHTNGLFVYAATQQQVALGDGYLCVGQPFFRRAALSTAPLGSADFRLNFETLSPAGTIAPGTTWNFQFYYRNVNGPGGTGFNLSDGLQATFDG